MPEPTKPDAAARLAAALERVTAARRAARAGPADQATLSALKAWQAARFERTYADLLAHPRHAEAARFFLTDLYGAQDYSQRDADLARILPKLVALLPAAALTTIADAVELDALSEDLDAALAARLAPGTAITEAAYACAYRACANRPSRERQVALIREIGETLDRLTRVRLIESTLQLMRAPARMAGLGHLQGFLERGFGAFKRMGGAAPFLDAVESRETLLLERLFAAAENPFAGLGNLALS